VIIETTSLTTIGVGSQKVQTEVGDAALRIPNLILPAIELMEPTSILPDVNADQYTSFLRNRYVYRTNQASADFTVIRLGKGLWDISFQWSLRIAFAAPVPFNTVPNYVRLVSPIGGINNILAALHLVQNEHVTIERRFKILLREVGAIDLGVGVTGAADFLESDISMCGVKLL